MNLHHNKNTVLNFLGNIFGLRTLKTALATSLAIAIAQHLNLNTPLLAGISAVVSMTSSVFDSYTISINRMLSTIIGAFMAWYFHTIAFTGYIPIGIGIIIIINICNLLKWKKSITLACVVFIVVMLYEPGVSGHASILQYGINRTLDTFVGLLVGFLTNYLILPPNRAMFLHKTYEKSLQEFEETFKAILSSNREIPIGKLIDDINEINVELKSIRNDKKLRADHKFNISHLAKINSQFFSAFGLITQLTENGHIPQISEENKAGLREYFGCELKVNEQDLDPEFKTAFNYYLKDLIGMMFVLRAYVDDFEKTLIKKGTE